MIATLASVEMASSSRFLLKTKAAITACGSSTRTGVSRRCVATEFGTRVEGSGSQTNFAASMIRNSSHRSNRCLAKFVAAIDSVDDDVEGVMHKVDTLGGLMVPQLQADGQVRVDMGAPILQPDTIPTRLDPASSTLSAPAGFPGKVEIAATTTTKHQLIASSDCLPCHARATADIVVAAPLAVSTATFSATPVSMGNPHCVMFARDGSDIRLDTLDFDVVGPQVEAHNAFPAKVRVGVA